MPIFRNTTNEEYYQVPCGIYDDPMIVAEVEQCVETTKNAMAHVKELESGSGTGAQVLN
jgi:hypothetical protein